MTLLTFLFLHHLFCFILHVRAAKFSRFGIKELPLVTDRRTDRQEIHGWASVKEEMWGETSHCRQPLAFCRQIWGHLL